MVARFLSTSVYDAQALRVGATIAVSGGLFAFERRPFVAAPPLDFEELHARSLRLVAAPTPVDIDDLSLSPLDRVELRVEELAVLIQDLAAALGHDVAPARPSLAIVRDEGPDDA